MLRTSDRQASANSNAPTASAHDEPGPAPVLKPGAAALVIDTNVLLDWLVFADRSTTPLAAAVTTGQVRWITTAEMIDELSSVLTRPLAERWESARKRALTLEIASLCEHWPGAVLQAPLGLRCRDRADQKFIDLAIASGASALITRDRALLELRRRSQAHGVSIVAPAQWSAMRAAAATAR